MELDLERNKIKILLRSMPGYAIIEPSRMCRVQKELQICFGSITIQ